MSEAVTVLDRDDRDLSRSSSPVHDEVVWPPHKGTDLGNYLLLEEIGRGGMGIVYRAEQKGLNRMAAVKLILAGRHAAREDVERFFSEAQVAAKLRHPNLIGVYEVGQRHGWHFIAMEVVVSCAWSLCSQLCHDVPVKPHGYPFAFQVEIAVWRLLCEEHGLSSRVVEDIGAVGKR